MEGIDRAGMIYSEGTTRPDKSLLQFTKGSCNEFNAPVFALFQSVKNPRIENEHGKDPVARLKCMKKACIVPAAEIPAEPEDGNGFIVLRHRQIALKFRALN
jgi:hypothetical protein